MAAIAYLILQREILRAEGRALGSGRGGGSGRQREVSALLYLLAIGAAFIHPQIADGLYVLGALMWLIPDPRIERALAQQPGSRPTEPAAPRSQALPDASPSRYASTETMDMSRHRSIPIQEGDDLSFSKARWSIPDQSTPAERRASAGGVLPPRPGRSESAPGERTSALAVVSYQLQ